MWRDDGSGNTFLVTKVYTEVFTQYAMLRPANLSALHAETIRVKVSKSDAGATLPGYTYTQDSHDF
ncbi:MAG TPA: hypothetical protein VFK06_03585 [Candidatus Angelobacter sp.]|nr:hypothetical protein [Candidatus Angelobacter sp.]